MKERPILFSGALVRAILDGRKTQTRRVINPQPDMLGDWPIRPAAKPVKPYADAGDLLYVRESFCFVNPEMWHGHIAVCPSEDKWPGHRQDWIDGCREFGIGFAADGDGESQLIVGDVRWTPSIHMPKWASRIWLRVVDVNIERLQEIKNYQAVMEGVDATGIYTTESARANFAKLWDKINAKRGYGWAENPWVWAVEFEVVSTTGKPESGGES